MDKENIGPACSPGHARIQTSFPPDVLGICGLQTSRGCICNSSSTKQANLRMEKETMRLQSCAQFPVMESPKPSPGYDLHSSHQICSALYQKCRGLTSSPMVKSKKTMTTVVNKKTYKYRYLMDKNIKSIEF